jgi:hypothetical protein
MRNRGFALTLVGTSTLAWAHEGHGLEGGSHWHASDAFGFALVGALGAVALWLWLRRK